ncbi:hypothetical protein [Candidatus Phytoplasma solani]|uniref:Uncharacterized protein n=1 Tax=Candidatus Phytoplasma solani TaxID=69896 RepID=A0A421NUG0_9MOLU|nr:hypothetical protein [Candidatus Phytoplasma solani]RMI87560.1 hypothetical protein PSSA1_v1c7250 [Candidatus Phytoplasma solani]RMI88691.1 hypothetical protein PSSA1_v1c4200 [Candidatus Phytoplasma solani]
MDTLKIASLSFVMQIITFLTCGLIMRYQPTLEMLIILTTNTLTMFLFVVGFPLILNKKEKTKIKGE